MFIIWLLAFFLQAHNIFINHYNRKRSISTRKFNANYIHSREMETLLKKSSKFIETRACQIESNVSKMLAREKAKT